MSNTIITSRIAIPFVAEVESAMPILMNGNRQFDKNFVGGHGTTIDVIIPGYGAVHVGADMSAVDLSYTAAKVSVTLVQRRDPLVPLRHTEVHAVAAHLHVTLGVFAHSSLSLFFVSIASQSSLAPHLGQKSNLLRKSRSLLYAQVPLSSSLIPLSSLSWTRYPLMPS